MRLISLALAAFLLHFACPAYADTNTSATTLADWHAWANKNLSATYFGVYRGGPLSRPGYSLQPGVDGVPDPTSPQSTENYINMGYKLDKDTIVGVSTHFYYTPLGVPQAHGDPVEMLDPALMFSKANWISLGDFKVKGMFFVTLPMSKFDYLRRHEQVMSVSPTFNATYDIPRYKLTLALYGYVTAYLGGSASIGPYRTYKVYAAPNVNYQFAKTVGATLWVDLFQVTRATGTPFISGMDNYAVDIEPGINWDILPNLSFNPMLNIYPSNMTMNATSLQAVLVGKLF